MIRGLRLHRRSHAERLMSFTEIVVREMERDGGLVIRELFT